MCSRVVQPLPFHRQHSKCWGSLSVHSSVLTEAVRGSQCPVLLTSSKADCAPSASLLCQWDRKGPHCHHWSAKPQLSPGTACGETVGVKLRNHLTLPRNVEGEGQNWDCAAGNMLQRIERLSEKAGERKLSLWFLPDVSFIFYQSYILPDLIIKIQCINYMLS